MWAQAGITRGEWTWACVLGLAGADNEKHWVDHAVARGTTVMKEANRSVANGCSKIMARPERRKTIELT